jgi:hypothetical protein
VAGESNDADGRFGYLPLSQSGMTPEQLAENARRSDARARAEVRSRQDDGSPRVIGLMSDYSTVPLWSGGNISIEWLELSPELEGAILAWDQLFQTHFHWDDGWRDLAARAEYARLGPVLRDRLAVEIAEFGVVELNMWPTEPPTESA